MRPMGMERAGVTFASLMALGPDLALHVGEEPRREEAVDLGGHRQLTRASGRRMGNTAPHPGGLVTAISPPCRVTIS